MRSALFVLASLLGGGTGPAAERVFDFSQTPPGQTPPGFRSTLTGEGQPGEWKVVLDETPSLMPPISPDAPVTSRRPVLAQVARDRTDERFPLLLFDEEVFGDFTFTTRFKIVAGEVAQMAGIAFRVQDERNHYYIRASALGSNIYFFKRVDGHLIGPIGNRLEIPAGVWHELTIQCKGNEIRCHLNGKEAFPALGDNSFTSGKIGFWTKSDAVSYFCDARILYQPKESLAQVLRREALEKYPRLLGVKILARTPGQPLPMILASGEAKEIGQPGTKEDLAVIEREVIYHAKTSRSVTVTLPLRDRNGETVAAVRVSLKPFPGQTEKNAIYRALPVVKQMEGRVRSAADLAP